MRARLPVIGFVVWTVLVWIGRIGNVIADDDLSAAGAAWRIAVAVAFVVLGLAVFVARLRGADGATRLLAVLVACTVGWWLVRGVGTLVDDDDVGFKVVHTVLMVVSIGLAGWAWRRRDG